MNAKQSIMRKWLRSPLSALSICDRALGFALVLKCTTSFTIYPETPVVLEVSVTTIVVNTNMFE